LDKDKYITGAHCDAKGKMWAVMNADTIGEHYLLSGHNAEISASRTQLENYGVFSITTISDAAEQWFTFGLGGNEASQWLQSKWQVTFNEAQNAVDIPNGKILRLDNEHFLLIIAAQDVAELLNEHQDKLYTHQIWTALNIQLGVAYISEPAISQYVPQMLNLHCLNAISFEKGCYTGQEMVARMKYLGKNKRAAYILTGHAQQMPEDGQELQLAIGENWRRSGSLINVAGSAKQFHALAVLPNDMAPDALLRIKDDADSALTIIPLPYSLDAE
jgi:folate-binding protein YgfZ